MHGQTDRCSYKMDSYWVLPMLEKVAKKSLNTQQIPENFNGINFILSLLAPFRKFRKAANNSLCLSTD